MQSGLTRRELVRGAAAAAAAAAAGTGGYLLLRRSPAPALEPLRLDPRGSGFVGAASGRAFRAWGFNWGGPGAYRDLDVVEQRFSQMRSLGSNTVRLNLQFGDVMLSPSRTREAALSHLASIVRLAERERLYLDVSSNEVWLPANAPPWYDGLDENARWNAQAVYWGAVAEVCAKSPAVFCYDLLSEPIVGDGAAAGDWYTGELAGFHFVQRISLQLVGRQPAEVAQAWIERLKAAIRAHDTDHLITVGLIADSAMSGFDPAAVAPQLDFLAVHVYPRTGQQAQSTELVRRLAALGKPVLVEETYPFAGDVPTLEDFILGTRPYAAGWLSFYFGRTPSQLAGSQTFQDQLQRGWLELFQKYAPTLGRTPLS